uniref:UBC core domain-containing protein n=1 Tax=Mesocestoides corti TaxID=53468 RepID=A0A5K3FZ16_MESCO
MTTELQPSIEVLRQLSSLWLFMGWCATNPSIRYKVSIGTADAPYPRGSDRFVEALYQPGQKISPEMAGTSV